MTRFMRRYIGGSRNSGNSGPTNHTPRPTATRKEGPMVAAAECRRVCRAWHRACEVEVLTPGIRGAKG